MDINKLTSKIFMRTSLNESQAKEAAEVAIKYIPTGKGNKCYRGLPGHSNPPPPPPKKKS